MTHFISVSEFNKRCNETLGYVGTHKLTCIHNGVDTATLRFDSQARTEFRRQFQIPEDAFVVTQVSHMIEEKGIGDLLEAACLLKSDDRIQFCLVGEGHQRTHYEDVMRKIGLTGTVRFTGTVANLCAAYSGADVVCQVSRWQEAFGATVAEAMSCQRPVIASRVGGIPEIVEDASTGLLVDPVHPEQIAAAITSMAGNEGLRRTMGEAGCARAKSMFDLTRNVRRLLNLYRIAPLAGLPQDGEQPAEENTVP